MLPLVDKVAIITGGAAGIGRGIVQCFVESGARVAIADWNDQDGESARDELVAKGYDVAYFKMDVKSESNINQVVEATLERFGRIDVLVNDIGTHLYKPVLEVSGDEFDKLIHTDLRGHFFMSKAVVPHMIDRRYGSIVHISSIHALATRPSFTLYAAAKGGIVAMTRGMALEWAPYGIRVNTVLPGMSRSKQFNHWLSELPPDDRVNRLKQSANNTPLGRIGEPKEIGHAVAFLASDLASFITGAILPVDGGESVHLRW